MTAAPNEGVLECPECRGSGCEVFVRPVHTEFCTDSRCSSSCPIEEQYQEECWVCGGTGKLPTIEELRATSAELEAGKGKGE